jgi:CRP/FNR family cyclic AMP-dependent transcriptional regulator
MSSSEIVYRIIQCVNCPCYDAGDEFSLSGNALLLELEDEKTFITTAMVRPPRDKKTCRILVSDLTRALIDHESIDKIPPAEIKCSGCSGVIKAAPQPVAHAAVVPAKEGGENIDIITGMLSNFSIFQSLDRQNLRNIVSFLKLKKYPKGAIILKKGAPAQNLFIILSGTADVLDDEGVCLSTLKKGDVFGEMSLISGDPVAATIKVVTPATVIFIKGPDFRQVLHKFPSIQMYLARLLAQRLAKSNVVRAEEIASGMVGKLSELPPSELVQLLNLNQKTGKLILTLPKGKAELVFRDGELINAQYGKMNGKKAFYLILNEKDGRFKFQNKLSKSEKQAKIIGPFMEMLMDGVRKADEANYTKKEDPGQTLL